MRQRHTTPKKLVVMAAGISLLFSACSLGKPTETPPTVQSKTSKEVTEEETKVEESSNAQGVISSITMAQMESMLAAGETFLVSFVTTTCPYCHDFHDMLVEYNKDHDILMYQVILDYEETGEEENRAIVASYFEEFNTVPGVFYVENGKNSSYLDTYNLGVGEEVFDQWIQENHIHVPVNGD